MKRIILDCDPGIDDAVAIILAAKSAKVQVEAITTVTGNLTADLTATNARKVLELIGRGEIPVAQGMERPLVEEVPANSFFHGEDGLGNTGLPDPHRHLDSRFAPDLIRQLVDTYAGNISLVATGPLTNIALAILQEPRMVDKVNELIIMGGAYGFNEYAYTSATANNPVSEWNIAADPEAARIVFHSGIKLTAVGLDVATHPDMNFFNTHISKLEVATTRESRFLMQLLRFVEERNVESYSVLMDALAVAAAIDPTLVKTRPVHVDIETKGELTRGQTVADHRRHIKWDHLPLVQVADDADFDRFLTLVVQAVTE